jgi:signal transduction histidine kinase
MLLHAAHEASVMSNERNGVADELRAATGACFDGNVDAPIRLCGPGVRFECSAIHGGVGVTELSNPNSVPLESLLPEGAAPLESILCTEELRNRQSRPPDHEKENSALVALSSALADSPRTILQTLAEKILDVLGADSAGLSLLTKDGNRFYWAAIAGEWRPHIGGGTPRDFGPCGDVLDRDVPMLFSRWDRRYPYLSTATPLADEGLLAPFYVKGKSVGTVWAIAHNNRRKFDAEDVRLLESMGRFASAAYQVVEAIEDLSVEITARAKAESELRDLTDDLERQVRFRTEELEHRNRQLADAKARLAEEKLSLERSEAYMAEAQRLSHTGSWYFNIDTGEHFWSRESFAILDFDPEEIEESYPTLLQRIHPEDRARVDGLRSAAARDKRDFEAEFRLLLPTGSIRYVRGIGHCSLNEAGQVEFIGAMRDITESKLAQEELRRSEALLAEGQHLSRTGSFSWRVTSDEVTWSDELYRIYEFQIGVPVTLELMRTRVHPEDVSLLEKLKMADQTQNGMNDFEWQYRLLMPDGSIKYLHAVADATRDQEGQLEYIAAVQDVTARRVSEGALAKARAELAKVTRATTLGVLTASIAHEVNQPLSGIITNAGTCLRMLDATPPDLEGARETARRTIRDGNRAADVITRLRALFSKGELTLELLDLNEVTHEVMALSLSDLQRNRIALQSELAEDLPTITGDRIQLQQVILNLLRNASDAMVALDDRPRQLLIRTERDDEDRVRMRVRDTGVGVDPESMNKLFDAFYTTKADGMGIGLSVSRSIIESHHGRLWAEPNDGRPGATFSFSIPSRPENVTDVAPQ